MAAALLVGPTDAAIQTTGTATTTSTSTPVYQPVGPIVALPIKTVIETFTGDGTIVVGMPGTPTRDGGLQFSGTSVLNNLQFTPGTVALGCEQIDFYGGEGTLLADSYPGSAVVPVASGPATVNITGAGNASSDPTFAGSFTGNNVPLGPAFSASYLDFPIGTTLKVSSAVDKATVDAAMNAYVQSGGTCLAGKKFNVTVDANVTVTSVDPINGIINGDTTNGKVTAWQGGVVAYP